MILANLRERLTDADLQLVVELLSRGQGGDRRYYTELAEKEGPDRLLDDPGLMELLGGHSHLTAPSAPLFLYVTLRHTLRDCGIQDPRLADYLGRHRLESGGRDSHRL